MRLPCRIPVWFTWTVATRLNQDLTDHACVDQDQKNLEIKPLDAWLFWIVRLQTLHHILVRVPLQQKSSPNFMSGWLFFRWLQWRFVQTWLSIILMICKHSTECIMWRGFLLDHTKWMWSFLYVLLVRDEETRKHATKNPQKDVSFFQAKIDTDTYSQYDQRILG